MNYYDQFCKTADSNPDVIALVDHEGKRRTSYAELRKLSDNIASVLLDNGVKPGQFVVLNTGRRMEYVASCIAIMKLGCGFVPTLPSYPEQRIDFIRKECGCAFFITDSFFDSLPESHTECVFPEDFDREAAPACMTYTSGTTGKPKGILHPMDSFTQAMTRILQIIPSDISNFSDLAEFSFIASILLIFSILLLGQTVHIISEKMRMSLTGFAEYIEKESIEFTFLSSSHLLAFENRKLPLKVLLIGGEAFPKLSKDFLNSYKVLNIYGQTETVGGVICQRITDTDGIIPIGKPLSPLEVRILKEDGSTAAPGEKGELCIIGPFHTSYYKDEERSSKQFQFLEDGRQLIHTGDVAYQDENGNFVYVTRKDFMVKINGQRVDTAGVEHRIASVPGVNQCCVQVIRNQKGSNILSAYYTAENDITEDDVRKALAEQVPDYMIPQYITRMTVMPLNASGKIDRNALPDPLVKAETAYEAPVNETERTICTICENAIGCNQVGRTDNLASLGADSLSCMKILAKLEEEFHISLEPSALLNATTPAAIARLVNPAEVCQEDTSAEKGTPAETGKKYCNTSNILLSLAMFCLPFVHLIEEICTFGYEGSLNMTLQNTLLLFSTPTLFMIIIGYKLSFGDCTPGRYCKEGLSFLKICLIFDIFRWVIPMLILSLVRGVFLVDIPMVGASDIYIFMGFFLITFALFKKMKLNDITMAIISIVLLIIFYPLSDWYGTSETYLGGTLVGEFIFSGDYSFFPLFGWMFVPMTGYLAGKFLQKKEECKAKRKLVIGIISLIIFIVAVYFFAQETFTDPDCYMCSIPEYLLHISLSGIILCLVNIPAKSRLFSWLDKTSSLLMPFYLIHYTLVTFVMSAADLITNNSAEFTIVSYLLTACAITVVSYLLAKKWGTKLLSKLM